MSSSLAKLAKGKSWICGSSGKVLDGIKSHLKLAKTKLAKSKFARNEQKRGTEDESGIGVENVGLFLGNGGEEGWIEKGLHDDGMMAVYKRANEKESDEARRIIWGRGDGESDEGCGEGGYCGKEVGVWSLLEW